MKISLPAEVTSKVAFAAQANARRYATSRGWVAGSHINPVFGIGYAGIRSAQRFLMYQELGTQPHVMWHLEGKTIPIRDAQGLRFIKATGVGQPGWVTLPDGRKIWRPQKWRHPGIKATHFMSQSIDSAIRDSKPYIQQYVRSLIGGK